METKIILTCKKVAQITGMSPEYVIKSILKTTPEEGSHTVKPEDRRKYIASRLKKLLNQSFELTDEIKLMNPNAVSDDLHGKYIIHEYVEQVNRYPHTIMARIVDTKKCVETIWFQGAFKHYEDILTPENQILILKKLAESHIFKYGDKTAAYKNYNQYKKSLYVHPN